MGIDGKIYEWANLDKSLRYIGATRVHYLSDRMALFRHSYRKGNCPRLVKEIFDTVGPENTKIILLETIKFDTSDELKRATEEWIDSLDCLNKKRTSSPRVKKIVAQ